MASFPNSVKTFATRSNGQTIADTWFNDPDDEITAIEDGLRNGTAPLNSSNSTFTHVTAGTSTFAGLVTTAGSTLQTLAVVSNSSFGASIYLGGVNSSATLSTLTDMAVKDQGAIGWANSGNSSGIGYIGWKDLGSLDSTTTVSLAFQGNSTILALVTFVTRGAFSVIAQMGLRGITHTVDNVFTAGGNFGSTAGDAKVNVYWSAANTRYEIENKTGSTLTISACYQGVRV